MFIIYKKEKKQPHICGAVVGASASFDGFLGRNFLGHHEDVRRFGKHRSVVVKDLSRLRIGFVAGTWLPGGEYKKTFDFTRLKGAKISFAGQFFRMLGLASVRNNCPAKFILAPLSRV